MEARLTFAIPFYRGLDYLKIAIESVLAQSHPGWRLLVCDDGESEQGAAKLVGSYRDRRIEYHRNERNLGMVRNWNRCCDLAATDLVTLLHADDRLLPSYAELILELADRHSSAGALFCGSIIIDANGRPCFSLADAVKRFFVPRGEDPIVLKGESGVRALMAGNFIMCPTLCFRKGVLAGRRFSEAWTQVQDLEFTTRLLLEGETLVGSRKFGYAYRRHADSATTRQSESLLRFDEEFHLFDLIAERTAALGWNRAARVSQRRSIRKLHLLYATLYDLVSLHPGRALMKTRFLLRRW